MTRIIQIASIFILLLILFAEDIEARTFKVATISPDGLSWMKKMRAGMEEIEKTTQGRVKFKVYPGGVQGDDETVLRKMRIGQLQGGVVAAGSLTRFYPDLQIYNLPLRFENYEEVDYVRERLDQRIIEGLDQGGLVSFSLIETGFAYILSTKPIANLEELRQLKPWVPDGDTVSMDIIRTFEITPIPLQITDVLAGLQTGLIDAVAVPPIVALALQWHNQVGYITQVPLVYIYSMMALDKKAFGSISGADQKTVLNTLNKVFSEVDKENRSDNLKAYEAILNQGIKENHLQDMDVWHKMADKSIAELVSSGKLGKQSLDLLNKYLEEVRSKLTAN